MESIKNIAARHKMSEGAIKQNLLRNKRKLKKMTTCEEHKIQFRIPKRQIADLSEKEV